LYERIVENILLDSTTYTQERFEEVAMQMADTIAVDFTKASQLNRFGLEDGDRIFIPRELNVVYVQGEVKNKGGHAFIPGRRAKYYLNAAGGYKKGVNSRDVYVEYANGKSAYVRKFLGLLPIYPRVYSNSTIVVVQRPKSKQGVDPGQLAAYTSSLASISSITLGIIYLLRP
jgi:hypothetical protein